jgi:hypothetical protein
MKQMVLLITTSFLLTSCSLNNKNNPNLLTACPVDGGKPTLAEIKYKYEVGKKLEMSMKLKFDGESGNKFEIKLKPTGRSSNDVMIKTKGVSVTSSSTAVTDYSWLDGRGSYNSTASDGNAIVLCVPANVPAGTWYKFDISVGGIGTIDPRFDVN